MTRNQQIMLGRKIKKLITGRIGSSFSGTYQGAGEVATLVIAASSKKFTSKVKHFLREELLLDLHVGSKNHGSGEHYTLQIALSDISEKSKKIIEEKIGKMNESKEKKEVVEIPTTEEKKEETHISHFSHEDFRPSEEDSSPRPNFIKKISPFLNGVFRFESKFRQIVDPFVFDKEKTTKDYLAISCKSIRIAIEVEMSLGWFLRDQSIIVRDETELLINQSEAKFNKGDRSKSHYCLPPRSTANILEIVSRLSHIRIGSKPKVESVGHNHFSVSYAKKEMIETAFNDLRDMGWTVQKVDGAFLIECIDWGLSFVTEERTINPVPNDDIVIPGLTDAEKETLVKLQALLVADKETFDLLSEAKKKEVVELLRTIEKKKKAEEAEKYVESLLSVFKDYR